MKSQNKLRAAVVSVGLISVASQVLAVDRSWLASGGGAFQAAGNWSGSIVPTNADRAFFDITNTLLYTVSFSASATTDQLLVDDSVFFNVGSGRTYTVDNTGATAIEIGTNSVDISSLNLSSGTLEALGGTRIATGSGSAGGISIPAGTSFLFTSLTLGEVGSGTASLLGTVAGSTMVMGSEAGASGIATFGSGSSISGIVTLGNAGNGTLTFAGGAGTFSAGGLVLGSAPSSNGTVLLTDGKTISASTAAIGSQGRGMVTITNGTFTASSVDIAQSAGGSGTLLVDGQFSPAKLIASTSLRAGQGDAGTLLVTRGGAGTIGLLLAGEQATGVGYVRVDQHGSLVGTSGADIGSDGIGTLEILTGGSASFAGQVYLGRYNTGAKGTVNVSGLGSGLSVASDLIVGNLGTGTLNVSGGATVTAATMLAGPNPGGVGTIAVSGAGARIQITGAAGTALGHASGGVAYLEIGPEGSYTHTSPAGQVSLQPGSFLKLNGGTLGASTISASAGQFAWNSGTLILTSAGGGTISASSILGDSLLIDPTHSLSVTQALNNHGLLSVRDGWLSAGTIANAAGATFFMDGYGSSVTAAVNNSGLLRGVGRITGSFTNNANGELRLTTGEAIEFTNTAVNSGSITLVGGEFRVNGALTNNPSGRISGRGLLSAASISNSGTIQFSGDFSEVFGSLTLNSGGKVIVSGNSTATFYTDVIANAGSEFRVSSGTAVFFGVVAGTSNFTGGGVKIFENIAIPGPLLTTGASVVNPGGALSLPYIRETSLTLEGGSVVLIPGSPSSRLEELTINDGTIDLNDNELIIDYTGSSPIADIRGYLASGAMFSSAADASSNPVMAIGYHENNLGSITFAGQSVDATSLMIGYTLWGDATFDGKVTTLDFNKLAGSFGQGNRFWEDGDFNYDGLVDSQDFNALIGNYGHVTVIGAASLGALVPEPLCFGWLGLMPLLLRRHRLFHRRDLVAKIRKGADVLEVGMPAPQREQQFP